MKKFLIIQTAFIGDVVLATGIVEKLGQFFPDARIDFLVRKGNEGLLANNPHINEIITWDKKLNKYLNFLKTVKKIRKNRYDRVINLQRFFTTGCLTALSGASFTVGFDKNPLSFSFSRKVKHIVSTATPYLHEVERNNSLIADITDTISARPRLYPSATDFEKIKYCLADKYVTMTPSSVWFTKKYPDEKWIELMNTFPLEYHIYILGGKDNVAECEKLVSVTHNKKVTVLAGELSFLQSAALMKHAAMNYVNDSAPLHFASAVNAPVTAIFCSTVPAFGFTPLSDQSYIIETTESLSCRPCGLHGKKACPLGHFNCAFTIDNDQLLQTIHAQEDKK